MTRISIFFIILKLLLLSLDFKAIFSRFLLIQTKMDAFSSFFESQNAYRWNSFKNFSQISPVVQSHLKQVYLSLCCALVASATGVYLHLLWNIGGLLATFAMLGCIFWLLSTPPYEERKRVGLLMAAGLFEGASIGPLIDLAIQIDPRYKSSYILLFSIVSYVQAMSCGFI
ncbi:hypothetical protein Patl1_18378 [Pistacia atlantica]|uniref:Uncharacterized protein n=1 Tax=Pistacia atlantica TaxID=434234 RepID=A0ACC1C306_9ROSI|nr:hypothetical protein Patl1_18378 [Pistacia atlantica]